MPISFLPLVMAVFQFGPTLFGDAEAVFNAAAHGEGGPQKIQNVIDGLAHLLGHAAAAAASVQPK